jgi:hypothetical protein
MTNLDHAKSALFSRLAKALKKLTAFADWCANGTSRYFRHRYAILFFSLLFTFIASPVTAALGVGSAPLQLLLAINLIIAILPIKTLNVRRTLVTLLIVALAVRLLAGFFGQAFSSALGVWTLVGLVGAGMALRSVFRARSVDSEHIYAALSAYLLAGLSFGVLYWSVERTSPGSLLYAGANQLISQADGIYFSFVTLATLGYGDFVPKSDLTRGLAIVEAVAGQLYLSVMVARLVSLWVARGLQDKPSDTDVR